MLYHGYCLFFFVFKQKTAYEMRISDWSSDVCSSDLLPPPACAPAAPTGRPGPGRGGCAAVSSGLSRPRGRRGCVEDVPRYDPPTVPEEIGRASCRERVCQYV